MFDQKTYCPYTGLRSFTEEEAIYFKGRDQHIEEASKQLEDRKFLMLTGSSGDGKSSLVYAGIVPYARSGFIKSQFSNWLVADFKPERKPFRNLCESLSTMLGIPNVSTVEAELSHGYSSLVELYKNSDFYNKIDDSDGEKYSDKEKSKLRRESANLLILADQFEEFFTNPENYFKGKVSQESSLVINLLLETARIAQEENLPIYVVCTMRSDYIGQCSAFRGLPEFIGYSQFFVPRLNRKQLQEVIEEPAVLSGNSISKRLVERLIYDITEGVDQLPILQHALNQIWRAADNGKQEMDLIHYGMVGGMSGEDLPDLDRNTYQDWFQGLPKKIQKCYEQPNLQNVLNTHANKLHATAVDYYNKENEDQISEEDARHIIHNVFVCLTKIDHARAVRNRMTLDEITAITDIKGLTSEKVKKITAIFREPNNTLIQPFIDDAGNDPLQENDLLDISHESLIRNWGLLKTWAKEEYSHVNTYRDFSQQVERWNKQKRSSDYLLPIGPLSHFEDWFKSIKPNKYWINRYNQEIENKEERLVSSENILSDSNQFLKASAQKHMITRTVMKLGARKIAIFLGVISILLFSSFYIYEEYSKSGEVISNKILTEGINLLSDENTDLNVKAEYAIEMIRNNPDNFDLIFSDLDPHLALELSLGVAADFTYRYQHSKHTLLDQSIIFADSMLNKLYKNNIDGQPGNQVLKDHAYFLYELDLIKFFQPSENWENLATERANVLGDYVLKKFQSTEPFNPDPLHLNNALELIVNHNAWNNQEIKEVLQYISPLDPGFKNRMSEVYQSSKSIRVGQDRSQFGHNGLYQELAYLYAQTGNVQKALQCVDTLLTYNTSYFGNNYNLLQDNATNISVYFLINNKPHLFEEFVDQYTLKSGKSKLDFLDQLSGRSIISQFNSRKLIDNTSSFLHNLNLGLMNDATRAQIFEYYEAQINLVKNSDERNFRLALMHKHNALFRAQKQTLLTGSYDMDVIGPMYAKALNYYEMVPDTYLSESANRMSWSARSIKSARKAQFIFPGFMEYQTIWVSRYYGFQYMNTSFIEYLTSNGYVNTLFMTQDDFSLISEWTSIAINVVGFPSFAAFGADLNYDAILSFINELKDNDSYTKESFTSLKILLALKLFESGKELKAIDVMNEINYETIPSSLPDITRGLMNLKFVNIGNLGFQLKINGEDELFDNLINAFPRPVNRTTLLAYVASRMGNNGKTEVCSQLLARAKAADELRTTENQIGVGRISVALALLPKLEGYEEARRLWKNLQNKNGINLVMARNLSSAGFAWRAYEDIEKLTPAQPRLIRYRQMGRGIREYQALNETSNWKKYDSTNPWFWDFMAYSDN